MPPQRKADKEGNLNPPEVPLDIAISVIGNTIQIQSMLPLIRQQQLLNTALIMISEKIGGVKMYEQLQSDSSLVDMDGNPIINTNNNKEEANVEA